MPIKQEYLQRFLHGVAIDLVEALVRAAPNSAATASQNGRYQTGGGHLQRNIRYELDGNQVKISMPGYWVYIEYGTPPHIIRPKHGKALAWGKPMGKTKDGKTKREFTYKIVRHPGTDENPFVRDTLQRQFPDIVLRNVQRHLRG